MSRKSYLENGRHRGGRPVIVSLRAGTDRRLFGLNAGDWTVLLGGCGLSALAVFLL
jgi:hypothetical protein